MRAATAAAAAATLALAPCAHGASAAPGRPSVAFPPANARLPAVTQCYVIGAAPPGATNVWVDGTSVAVYRTGAFLAMVDTVPGETNTLSVACDGGPALVRRFFVAAPPPPGTQAQPPPAPFTDPDSDPRVKKPWTAWKAKPNLFPNRVQPEPGNGREIAHLPGGFAVQGAEISEPAGYVCVWLGGRSGFVPRARLEPAEGEIPPRDTPAPDVSQGFAACPQGRKAAEIRVLVDPGHGGPDTGALSPHGWCEKTANLLQALETAKALREAGFDVRMTRDGDSFPALYDRPHDAFAWHADAFVSIHHNSTPPDKNPSKERYTATFAYNERGMALAAAVQKRVAAALPDVPDRGALEKSLAVCRNPAVPSCLVEVDFISCPEGEEAVFGDIGRRRRVAEAIAAGIKDWAGL